MRGNIIQIDKADNVAVLLEGLRKGSRVDTAGRVLELNEGIPSGHKVALEDIGQGEKIIKYGYPIGKAVKDISRGDWVHSHNLKTSLEGKEDYNYTPAFISEEGENTEIDKRDTPGFPGYLRDDGKVGIRNEIWLIPTVGCINKVAERLASIGEAKYSENIAAGEIDGIYAFTHPYGCSQLGGDLLNTQKILAGLVKHPNAAGVLVLGLGCENNILEDFQEIIGDYNEDRVKFVKLQEIEDDLEYGLARINELLGYAREFKQEKVALSELRIGLKCGGSDAFQGLQQTLYWGRLATDLKDWVVLLS